MVFREHLFQRFHSKWKKQAWFKARAAVRAVEWGPVLSEQPPLSSSWLRIGPNVARSSIFKARNLDFSVKHPSHLMLTAYQNE